MKKTGIFIADGCEEIEALTVVDLLRRAGIPIDMISVSGKKTVTGAHGITFETDTTLAETDFSSLDGIILPGGMPGTIHLKENPDVIRTIQTFDEAGKLVAAICAAPTVLGAAGVLEGKKATCYPGMEDGLTGADFAAEPVVVDGHIITSRGMGTAIDFSLAIIAFFTDSKQADALAGQIVYR